MSLFTESDKEYDPMNLTKEEQEIRVLKGLCPHNKGWTYFNRYEDDIVYTCNICGEWASV